MKTLSSPPVRALSVKVLVAIFGLAVPIVGAEPTRLPGKFVWADLVTDQMDAARGFYSGMFDWRFRGRGEYLVASNHGRPLAALVYRERPTGKPKASPRWFGYLSVEDVEQAQQAVSAAGGRVILEAGDLRGRGKQAVFSDPEGALFGAIHTQHGDPPDATARVGDWVWIQLLSRDAESAAAFYRKVGRYQVQRNTTRTRPADFILSTDGIARATVRTIPSNKRNAQPSWLPFVRVARVADSVVKARELGGHVLVSPRPDLMNGQVAVVSDPAGAAIGLME